MKKFSIFCAAVILQVLPLQVNAQQNKSSEILSLFTSMLKALPAFELQFTMETDGSVVDGTIHSQKESFKLINNHMEIYCDGKTKWIYNIDNKEITIVNNDPSTTDLTENPMAFFTSLENNYSYEQKPKSKTVSNKNLWLIELRPKNKHFAYSSIIIGVEKESLVPVQMEYNSKDGTAQVIYITKFEERRPWPQGYFVFPENIMKGLNISDLR